MGITWDQMVGITEIGSYQGGIHIVEAVWDDSPMSVGWGISGDHIGLDLTKVASLEWKLSGMMI